MAHIVFDLSSSESRSRFRELAADMLDLLDGSVSERFLVRLQDKARGLQLAAPDYYAIILELLRSSGGCGFSLSDTGIRCPSCNGEQQQVSWLCARCGGQMVVVQSRGNHQNHQNLKNMLNTDIHVLDIGASSVKSATYLLAANEGPQRTQEVICLRRLC